MQFPRLPENEAERILELQRYEILNTQSEEDFDEIVRLASEICQVPISTITLIDAYRQWHKAKVGLEDNEGDRNITFCGHTILEDDIMEVEDAMQDDRFFDNPLVLSDPHIRFYAGIPIVSSRGYKIGTLCVIDRVPRKLSASQLFALRVLAKQVIKLFELRLKNKEIHEQKTMLDAQSKQLSELSAVQNKIISIISHDIRGPIASLSQLLNLQKAGALSTIEKQILQDNAQEQVGKTLNLLTNLVEWAALLRNQSEPEYKPVQIESLVSREIKTQELSLAAKQNTVEVNIPFGITVLSDENMLSFIIRNLVSNANKFTSAGSIAIVVENAGSEIKISVSDTGVGMNEEQVQRLFKVDKRFSRPGTSNETGSGLGLILIKEFVSKLGGVLQVASQAEKGTTVMFTLPVNANES